MEDQLSADQLAAMAAGNAAPGVGDQQQQAPTAFGGIEIPVFSKALEEATGGQFKSVSDLQAAQRALEDSRRIPEFQQRINDLEAQSQISPWANPLVQKINDVFKTQSPEAAKLYTDLAFTDLSKLDAMQAIRMQMSLENPTLTSEQVTALIYDKVGITDDMDAESLPAAQSAKLEVERQTALRSLEEKRVSYENPQAKQADPVAEQRAVAFVNGWEKTVLPSIKSQVDVMVPADAESGRPGYHFSFNPTAEATATVDAQVMSIIKGNPAGFPMTEAGLQAARELKQSLLLIADRQNFEKTLVGDIFAAAMEYAASKTAGPLPRETQPGAPAVAQQRNTRSVAALLKNISGS